MVQPRPSALLCWIAHLRKCLESLGKFHEALFCIDLAYLQLGMEAWELQIHKGHIQETKYLIYGHKVNLSKPLDWHNREYRFMYTTSLSWQLLRHSCHPIWLSHLSSRIYLHSSNLNEIFSYHEVLSNHGLPKWRFAKCHLHVYTIAPFNVL